MNIVYYCEAMRVFGEGMIKHHGYLRYNPETDLNEDVFFGGLYFPADYDAFRRHQGRSVVFWHGSDIWGILRSKEKGNIVRSKRAIHLCHNFGQLELLENAGLEAIVYPLFFGDLNKFQVSYHWSRNPNVYFNVLQNREKEYGISFIETAAQAVPYAKFHIYGCTGQPSTPNIIYHGFVPEDQMDEEIKEFQAGFQTVREIGFWISQTCLKSALMAQYPMALYPVPGVLYSPNPGNLIDYIEDLAEKETPNRSVREYFLKIYQNQWADLDRVCDLDSPRAAIPSVERIVPASAEPSEIKKFEVHIADPTKQRVSVSMIVKDEEIVLGDCLKSLYGFEEVVILDTGSSDKTGEVVQEFSKSTFADVKYICGEYKWNDDFAEARNKCLDYCDGDWILIIDADERLEDGGVNKVKELLKTVPPNVHAISFKTISERAPIEHDSVRLFRNRVGIVWHGAIHNYLSARAQIHSDIHLYYGYSPAHDRDPDRSFRILLKETEKNPDCTRERFYLAREYFYRKDWIKAVEHYRMYLERANFEPEMAEAWMQVCRCYNFAGMNFEARLACLRAIDINPDFKDALKVMVKLSQQDPEKSAKWQEYADLAKNTHTLFHVMEKECTSKTS